MNFRPPRRRKKANPNWPLRFIGLGVLLSLLIASLIVPVIQFRNNAFAFENERWNVFWELSLTYSMHWFIVMWVFFFGACLGSFLNVVAYRVPHGLTLMGSSRCPFCFVSIESKYNLPIVGWFWLRGKCAACRLPISKRYFIVEIFSGLLLVWIFLVQLVTEGNNLPGGIEYETNKLFRVMASGKYRELGLYDWTLIRITLVHCVVGYAVLTIVLMKLDRLRVPLIWAGLNGLFVYLMLVTWPNDFVISFAEVTSIQTVAGSNWHWGALFQYLPGLGLGMLIGAAVDWAYRRPTGVFIAFSLLGMIFGLSGVISLALVFLSLSGVLWLLSFRQSALKNGVSILLISFLIQLTFWKQTTDWGYWPSVKAIWWVDLIYGLVVFFSLGLIGNRLKTDPEIVDSGNFESENAKAKNPTYINLGESGLGASTGQQKVVPQTETPDDISRVQTDQHSELIDEQLAERQSSAEKSPESDSNTI